MSVTHPVLVFGEVLFDSFPDGSRVLGGAPFNVAWGLKGLGEDPALISCIGMDEPASEISERMHEWGLSTGLLQVEQTCQTGMVEVSLNDGEPTYTIREGAWDHISDQGISANRLIYHGSLALRSDENDETLSAIIGRSKALRFYDVNLRQPFHSKDIVYRWLECADWVKLNLDELTSLLDCPPIEFSRAEDLARLFRKEFGISNVLVTAGKSGALMAGTYGSGMIHPAPTPRQFVDTVGAGDGFTAVAIDGILTGMHPQKIVERAAVFASRVCGLRGATSKDRSFYSIEGTSGT